MGNPEWSYNEMIRYLDCLLYKRKEIDDEPDIEEIEKRINNFEHDNRFYYNCGVVASNVCNDIAENRTCDEMNAACGGLIMFEDLIGLEEED